MASNEDNVEFIPQGAIIKQFRVAGHDLVLSLPNEAAYADSNPAYFGETIGRVANRISGAKIDSLNGRSYTLTANNGPNTLHGGPKGWGKQIFKGPQPLSRNGREAVLFTYVSKDGDEGFPGTVELKVWYSTAKIQDDGHEKTELEIEYEVEITGDEVEETAVSVTNHSSFSVAPGLSIAGTEATLYTNLHQVTDDADLPTGAIEPFPGIEAGKMFVLGESEPKVDHCMVMNPDPSSIPLDTRTQELKKLCSFHHPETKMNLEALSTEPGFQFYTGEYTDVKAVDGAPARGKRSGFCVEASRYINAVNTDRWRGQVILKKGQKWGSRTVYRGWKD